MQSFRRVFYFGCIEVITENKTLPNGHLLLHSELEQSYCSSVYLQINKIRPNIKYKQKVTQT